MRFLLPILFLLFPSISLLAEESSLYLLKSNDTVRLTVFQEPDLTATEQLTAAGEVSFPLIGSIKLQGLSIGEAEALVTARYDADYLVSPSLSINVINAADEVISVLGAVNNPGQQNIPVNSTLDLVTALDSAGGLAPHGDQDRIELKRGGETVNYQLSALRASNAPQVTLQNGDRVNVPASPFANKSVTILGEVSEPGTMVFPISGKLSLDVLVASRGGLTEIADAARLTIKRNGEVLAGSLGKQLLLVPGDLVTIPPSRFAGKTVAISGKVAQAGEIAFPLDGRLDILGAITRAGGFGRLANRKKVTVTRTLNGREEVYRVDCADMEKGKIATMPLVPGDRIYVPERLF